MTADGSHLAPENEMKKHRPGWPGSFKTAVDRGQIQILFIGGCPVMKPELCWWRVVPYRLGGGTGCPQIII